jgi:hypothetical protein
MASHRQRLLAVLQARLETLPVLGSRVYRGWRHWSELAEDRFPCVFLEFAPASPDLTWLSGGAGEGGLDVDVFGYTKPRGPFADPMAELEARIDAREALLAQVVETVMADATLEALAADNAQAGGVGVVRLDVQSLDTDAGLIPGFGLFVVHLRGRLHIETGRF